ncbi:MAG TPA: NADH-quinone oxidoreductase subunit L [Coriobacteriia bacterium]|nr:NADH-quinone oxidoreductase subunit L [Coriobacteriia bacterium]
MNWVALIPILPAAAFMVLLPMSRRLRNKMLWLPVTAISGSTALSLLALAKVWPAGGEAEGGHAAEAIWHVAWPFAEIGTQKLMLSLALDPLAASMLVTVTIVATCVQIYSLGYMHKDERVGWYYAVVSLFTAAMLSLVLSSDLLLTFGMWEMMGLCSYLLIGFWYELEGPRKASQKAFLTTRVGDLGFLIALFAIYKTVGTFDLATVLETSAQWAPSAALVVSLGLLWAAMGKSAQIPLHVWLPDAMAGPTPASALIHAATMVAAGVFVVARTLPIFEHAPIVMTAMLAIGAATALAGGLMASVQHDIKKVAAYSTISQLGLMFVALGAGSATAALFHLTTHAFFKSLIFLGAGVIIHAAHTQDMREMGGLAKHLPITTAVFTVGSLALAGFPPLSGFFSKDEILALLLHEHHYVTFAVVVLASGVTAFYVTRLWFRVFAGPVQTEGLHEGHKSMTMPMVLLAAITVVGGFGTTLYAQLLGHEGEWPAPAMWILSLVIAGTGMTLGWWFYGRRDIVVNTRVWKQRLGWFYGALSQKLYFDLTYERLLIGGFFRLSEQTAIFDGRRIDAVVNGAASAFVFFTGLAWRFDGSVIDGAVNGLATISKSVGTSLRGLQSGRLQNYQRLVLGAVVLLMLYFVLAVKGA